MAKQSDLAPVDWEAMEPHFRAGILSYRQLGARFGCAPSAIVKHFDKLGVTRDLRARINAKAQEQVNAAAVNAKVNAPSEKDTVDANANLLATVTIGQRGLTDKGVKIISSLLNELELTIDAPETLGQVHDLLAAGEEPDLAQLKRVAELVSSLPERVGLAGRLIESLNRAIMGQRKVYRMDEDQKSADDSDSFENLLDMANGMLGRLK